MRTVSNKHKLSESFVRTSDTEEAFCANIYWTSDAEEGYVWASRTFFRVITGFRSSLDRNDAFFSDFESLSSHGGETVSGLGDGKVFLCRYLSPCNWPCLRPEMARHGPMRFVHGTRTRANTTPADSVVADLREQERTKLVLGCSFAFICEHANN